MVAIAGFPTVAASQAADAELATVAIDRHGGADRYSTSSQVAEAVSADAGGSLEWAVVVSGRSWPEAVVAASVAGSLDAPVIMTPPDRLRPDTAEFLARNGVSDVLVIDSRDPTAGPDARVGDAVVDGLRAIGISVKRISGDDRYGAATATATELRGILQRRHGDSRWAGVMPGKGRTAFVASGEVFADALVAGPIAARGHHPVLLTTPGELHPGVASYLRQAPVEHVVLMGGTAALSESVEASIRDLGVDVTRLAGATGFDTAVEAAELAHGRYSSGTNECFGYRSIGIARARVPFDAFSAGPLLARLCAPLVLGEPARIPAETAGYLDVARAGALEARIRSVDLQMFGGQAAISDAALSAYLGRAVDTAARADSEISYPRAPVFGTGAPAVPPGTCGGDADDPARRLLNVDPASYPAWSPDCKHIAYSSGGHIWIARVDGSEPRALVTDSAGGAYDPAWSADGSKIAYMLEPSATTAWDAGIWVIDVDGSGKKQLTDATYHDRSPAWSPDGRTIAFRRFKDSEHSMAILAMDPDGGDLRELTDYAQSDYSPTWSPDGTTIAFVRSGEIALMAADGSDVRTLGGTVNSSISWSPGGDRLVFVSHNADSSTISTVRLNGTGQQAVAEIPGTVHSPAWSPDGELIAFYTRDAHHYEVFVVGSAGTSIATTHDCKPHGRNGVTAGFPLPAWSPSAVGTVRVAVLFVDFPDAVAMHSTHSEVAESLPYMEEYLEEASGGRLDLRFEVLHEWLRAPQNHAAHVHHTYLGVEASQLSADLAAGKLDFSNIDAVMTVFPSDQFSIATAGGIIDVDGESIPTFRMNVLRRTQRRAITSNGWAAAHELLHVFGLADLYSQAGTPTRPDRKSGYRLAAFDFGIMGLDVYHFFDEHDPILSGTSALSSDHYLVDDWIRFHEMLAWSRFQLGWLGADQTECVEEQDSLHSIGPVSQNEDDVRLVAVPVGPTRVIALEVRRGANRDRWARIANEGVLAYTVDGARFDRPIKIGDDDGRHQIDRLPLLGVGDELFVWGYRIAVLAEVGDNYVVRIQQLG